MNSLTARLLAAAAVVLVAFVAFTGLALERAVRERALQAERDRLQGLSYALLGSAEIGADGSFRLPARSLPENRLGQPGSGLYAIVTDADGEIVWRSPSTIDPIDPPATPAVGEWRFAPPEQTGGAWLALAFGIRWVIDGGSYRYTLLVAQSTDAFDAQLARFRGALWIWLGLAALLLLVLQLAILRWGLAPLRRVARGLGDIESGRRTRIAGRYPAELRGLVDSLNAMLAGEKTRLERYRNALADLAHSLKTPIAVLHGLAGNRRLPVRQRRQLEDQLARINEIVDYQLQRAATAGTRTLAPPVAVRPLAQRLIEALRKVYADSGIQFRNDVPPQLHTAVDEGDLTEMLGNLLDNAAKYGHGEVRVEGRQEGGGTVLTVDDDGPGFPAGAGAVLLKRGVRADSRREGQGIGLAVTAEIVRAYGGTIRLEKAPDGGGRVHLQLP